MRHPTYSTLEIRELRAIGIHNYRHPLHPARGASRHHNPAARHMVVINPGEGSGAWVDFLAGQWLAARNGETPHAYPTAREAWRAAYRAARS